MEDLLKSQNKKKEEAIIKKQAKEAAGALTGTILVQGIKNTLQYQENQKGGKRTFKRRRKTRINKKNKRKTNKSKQNKK